MKIYFIALFFMTLFFLGVAESHANVTILPVTKFNSADMVNDVPAGWKLDKKTGKPSLEIKKENNLFYLHLISEGNSSFGLQKEFNVDVKKFPVLCWRWKANKLPLGGDVRKSATDDQALQLYVAFKPTGFPAVTHTPVIGYIWDSEAPKGWSGRSCQVGGDKLRYIVLRNRTDQTGQWYTERRNIYQDYKKLFSDIKDGEPQGLTTGVQIRINSQRTKNPADSEIAEIYFSADPKDIALAESTKEIKQTQDLKISAVKTPPPPQLSAAKKQKRNDCLNISIGFSPESTDVDDKYYGQMETIVNYLIKNPKSKITIVGYTDDTGKTQNNLAISSKRAASVKSCLINKFNIDSKRLDIKGAGFVQSVNNKNTEDTHKNHNRVTIDECP
jgi:outer membrane protein OmpA-like peptidoglycan-associated protein